MIARRLNLFLLASATACLMGLPDARAQENGDDPTKPRFDLSSFGRPDYPADSIKAGEEGLVQIAVQCRPDGHVDDATVEQSTGFARLDEAALAMVGALRCFPAHDPATGQAVAAALKFRYRYALTQPPPPPTHPTTLQISREEALSLIEEARAANPDLSIPSGSDPKGYDAAWSMTLEARPGPGSFPHPAYPAGSVAGRETGTVSAAFLCGRDGTVLRSRLIRSSGVARLDQALLDALPPGGACQPAHAGKGGPPVTSWGMLAYVFAPPDAAPTNKAAQPPPQP
ncbi:TonB family protein [Nitrospirillum iridis]|uniref:TonB family protein n=1 Tax=Nitrospirillum iridis TaxID=765888 RepID=A0A7X0ED49_9PROT|nr:TonB family protein [Nitrospirillum iridis]MBB6252432.1 TonB family protein [Nitrospirillum iridis]